MSEDKKVPKQAHKATPSVKYETEASAAAAYKAFDERIAKLEAPSAEDFAFTASHWSWLKYCMDLMFRSRKMPMPKPPK